MHTYRTANSKDGKQGFQVGFDSGAASGAGNANITGVGPHFEKEAEAAAFAAFMNGGRYEPDAIEELMRPAEEERAKARKEREQTAKREAEAEKERARREHPPAQADQSDAERQANEDVESEKTAKSERRPHASEGKRAQTSASKQHVKRKASKPARKHK